MLISRLALLGNYRQAIGLNIIGTEGRPFRSLATGTAGLLLLFALGSTATPLQAQTIRIKLVNGRTGSAMVDTCVNVWVGSERKPAMAIPTGKDGVASLQLADQDAKIRAPNRWRACGDFGVVNPVVKYADFIRVNAGHVLCQVRRPDHTWLATQTFSTKQILESGFVSANTCGKAGASPAPGEIVILVRPLHWWEKLRE